MLILHRHANRFKSCASSLRAYFLPGVIVPVFITEFTGVLDDFFPNNIIRIVGGR